MLSLQHWNQQIDIHCMYKCVVTNWTKSRRWMILVWRKVRFCTNHGWGVGWESFPHIIVTITRASESVCQYVCLCSQSNFKSGVFFFLLWLEMTNNAVGLSRVWAWKLNHNWNESFVTARVSFDSIWLWSSGTCVIQIKSTENWVKKIA